MRTIIIVLFLLAGISVNAQRNYKVGDTIKVDDNLTLIVTHEDYANIRDIKNQTLEMQNNRDISEYFLGDINASGFTPPLSCEIAKTMMQNFREIFTEEELNNFAKNATDYSSEAIDFWMKVDLKGDIVGMSISFWSKHTAIDAIPKEKIGKLYKLIVDRLKFNIRNTGLEYYGIRFRVKFKDVVNGTLDYSRKLRNTSGEYYNSYWKDGELYKFE